MSGYLTRRIASLRSYRFHSIIKPTVCRTFQGYHAIGRRSISNKSQATPILSEKKYEDADLEKLSNSLQKLTVDEIAALKASELQNWFKYCSQYYNSEHVSVNYKIANLLLASRWRGSDFLKNAIVYFTQIGDMAMAYTLQKKLFEAYPDLPFESYKTHVQMIHLNNQTATLITRFREKTNSLGFKCKNFWTEYYLKHNLALGRFKTAENLSIELLGDKDESLVSEDFALYLLNNFEIVCEIYNCTQAPTLYKNVETLLYNSASESSPLGKDLRINLAIMKGELTPQKVSDTLYKSMKSGNSENWPTSQTFTTIMKNSNIMGRDNMIKAISKVYKWNSRLSEEDEAFLDVIFYKTVKNFKEVKNILYHNYNKIDNLHEIVANSLVACIKNNTDSKPIIDLYKEADVQLDFNELIRIRNLFTRFTNHTSLDEWKNLEPISKLLLDSLPDTDKPKLVNKILDIVFRIPNFTCNMMQELYDTLCSVKPEYLPTDMELRIIERFAALPDSMPLVSQLFSVIKYDKEAITKAAQTIIHVAAQKHDTTLLSFATDTINVTKTGISQKDVIDSQVFAFLQTGKPSIAIQKFFTVINSHIIPSQEAINSFFEACILVPDSTLVIEKVFVILGKKEVALNLYQLKLLMFGLSQNGDVSKALKIISENRATFNDETALDLIGIVRLANPAGMAEAKHDLASANLKDLLDLLPPSYDFEIASFVENPFVVKLYSSKLEWLQQNRSKTANTLSSLYVRQACEHSLQYSQAMSLGLLRSSKSRSVL